MCFAHQADSLISFAFCLNQKKGLEKLTHTSLPSPPMAMRLSQWEKSFNTFGVFDTLGSEWEGVSGRRGVENTVDIALDVSHSFRDDEFHFGWQW